MNNVKCKKYFRPETLFELKEFLKNTSENVSYIAGGTDLILHAREKDIYENNIIVDIFNLKELKGIKEEGNKIVIGAGATHTDVEQSDIVNKYAKVLALACRSVGSVLIRNHSTLCGNICNASPAADSLSSLAVLGTKLRVLRDDKIIELDFFDVIDKPEVNKLQNKDLVVEIVINKLDENVKCDFFKLGRRKALAISRITISTICKTDESGNVVLFNITCGATFPKPMTFEDVNNILIGKKPSRELIDEVAKKLSDKIPEIAGIRKSTAYKQPVCEKMVKRVLSKMLLNEEV